MFLYVWKDEKIICIKSKIKTPKELLGTCTIVEVTELEYFEMQNQKYSFKKTEKKDWQQFWELVLSKKTK